MSLSKRLQRKAEQKLRRQNELLAADTGVLFSSALFADDDGFPFMKYIVNAIALFCAAFGSLNCFITAFELELNITPMTLVCIVFSLILSFMYVSNKAKIITYIGIFMGILISSTRYYVVVNSGICAIRNNCLKFIDVKVGLPFLREFSVLFSDEYIAMSIAICIFAVVLMIFLNIFISERMNLLMLFALTFPVVQFGMYFNFKASRLSMFCVLVSWMLVAAVKFSGAYNGLTRTYVSTEKIRNHKHSYGFVTDSKNVANIALVWLAFVAIVTGVVFAVVPADSFELSLPTNSIKTSSERVVKNFLSYGFSAVFSRERQATGSGQLSNISDIVFDGRTDLKVYLTDYKAERIYLRSFAGEIYNPYELKWETVTTAENAERIFNYSAELLKYDFENNPQTKVIPHKIGIKTVDANLLSDPLNVPYYSVADGFIYKSSTQIIPKEKIKDTVYHEAYTADFSPDEFGVLLNGIKDDGLKSELEKTQEEMRNNAYSHALEIPKRNYEAVKKFCDSYGIRAGDKSAVTRVIEALQNDFDYTLRPGKVPSGEDYINYFLLANQKGYCQHFASAATLIFRYLGIPARYAEGYVVDDIDIFNAKDCTDEAEISRFKQGDKVIEALLTDSNGHAWVEIYRDGFGWTPVEVTVAAPIDDAKQSFLSRLFGGANSLELSDDSQTLAKAVKKINESQTKINLKRLLLTAIIILIGIYFARMFFRVCSVHREFKSVNVKNRLNSRYRHLYNSYMFCEKEKKNLSYAEFFDILIDRGILDDASFCDKFEKALFGKDDAESRNNAENKLISLRKAVASRMNAYNKIRYYFVDFMW